ncbi:protein trichome birefringence-like 28 [Tasmannia lanceolata]|uniref:protein trichome birefringence-like 28 n=1 Tax=Tasmannia lanceolata TaxID=3420 RepID=UPI0040629682
MEKFHKKWVVYYYVSLVAFFIPIICIYHNAKIAPVTYGMNDKWSSLEGGKYNIFDGRWVYDPKFYPLYNAQKCPFLSEQVSCQKNGRPDSDYESWRWEAKDCEIPRFNGSDMLERWRTKRVIIVGDSLNRNQWESLACLLYSVLPPARTNVNVENCRHKVFRAMDYNCSVEFFWSPFLVQLDERHPERKVLKLDEISDSAKHWRGAGIMVFNTGHWWLHRGKVKAVSHWCYNQTKPIMDEHYVGSFPRRMIDITEKTLREMKTPVKYLNITRLSEYRKDAHTTLYTVKQAKMVTKEQRKQPKLYTDCSYWCLPGVPDTWNELLYASTVFQPSSYIL